MKLPPPRFVAYTFAFIRRGNFVTIPTYKDIIPETDQTLAREQHLGELRQLVGNVYPNKFDRSNVTSKEDTISNLLSFEPVAIIVKQIKEHLATLNEGEKPAPELKENLNAKLKEIGNVRISGRLTTTPRTMGKAAFVHLSDGVNRLQIYVRRDDIKGIANDGKNSEVNGWDLFKLLDGGDFIGTEGFLFLTNTGELSVHVETLQFLSKALLPMPDKMHGISDPELQRRYRYADLIADSLKIEHEALTTREVFERRAKLISGMRNYLDAHGYIEVETPMLTPKATGAAAKPFATHHNALDIPLYARIAPELYLKRLVVGGFEKVYELNRNFRNEGIDSTHNPEFTMLEFYCAYMDVNGMMDFCEAMIKKSVQKATGGSLQVRYGENEIDFSTKFERLTMKGSFAKVLSSIYSKEDAIAKALSSKYAKFGDEKHVKDLLDDPREVFNFATALDETQRASIITGGSTSREELVKRLWAGDKYEMVRNYKDVTDDELNESETAKRILYLFENFVEENLGITEIEENEEVEIEEIKKIGKRTVQPTFIIDYPKSISPLSKASPENPQIAERFELFINGMECANGFSELNDPAEQYERFLDQANARAGGDEEAMVLDEDYIRALSYGMPPAAGIGIGIDRLVMLLTNRHSIRDVILFPHLRPEKRETENGDEKDQSGVLAAE